MLKNPLLYPKYYKYLSIASIISVIFSGVSFLLLISDCVIFVGLIFVWVSLIAMLICALLFFASMIIQKGNKICRNLFLSILIISILIFCIYTHIHEIDRNLFNGFINKNVLTYDLNVDEINFEPSLPHKIYESGSMFLIFGLPFFTWLSTAISILYKLRGKTD